MRVVSVTSREPDYMTPDIKYLLRRKNRLMRRGALEEASALAVKIRRGIARHNSRELRKLDENACPKDLWECVNSLIHPRKTMAGCKVTADELNQHFAATSTDNSYQQVDLKTTANPNLSDVQIFYVIDHLRPTAEGTDGLPAWFLRLLAPICAGPIARLVNQSMCCSWVPRQWKTAILHPAPKVASPQGPSDYRPISVVPILSRVVERLVVHTYLYPTIIQQPFADSIKDQYAFRPTGSTTAALIDLLQQVTDLLQDNEYVVLISTDFSRAFDTVRHQTLMEKMATLDLPDHIFNWLANYFNQRGHVTRLHDIVSTRAFINASIVQGSVVGPPSYVVNASDLHPIHAFNAMMKYTDDTYLLVGSNHIATATAEFANISAWAAKNNLRLNQLKTRELVITRRRHKSNIKPE